MSGAFTAAAALTLLGTGAGAYANNQNLRKQDSQAASSIIRQGATNSQAGADVNKLNKAIASSNPQDEQKQQTAAYLAALQQAAPTQSAVNPAVRGASKRYNQQSADAQGDVADYARSTAGNIAATAAPSLQRIREGNAIANTASNLGILNDNASAQTGLLKTQLAGDQADPWITAAGSLLQGGGAGLATYAGSRMGNGKKGTGAGLTADNGLGSNPYLA